MLQLLVDAGGGNGIVGRLLSCDIRPDELRNLFITHSHADHILGAVWIVRAVNKAIDDGTRTERMRVLGDTDTLHALITICRLTLLPRHYTQMNRNFDFIDVRKQPVQIIDGAKFEFFNVGSENVSQTGFRTVLSNGQSLAVTGDEALTASNLHHCRDFDWVVCGAFCRQADAEIFRPYEKHHFTVADVARAAESARVRNLVIVHCEDTDLDKRDSLYAAEAAAYFSGRVITPRDGTVIDL